MTFPDFLTALLADFPSATDIHLTEGMPVSLRVEGDLVRLAVDGGAVLAALRDALGERVEASLSRRGAYDGAVSVGDVRCRVHWYRALGNRAAAIRVLPSLTHLPADPDEDWMEDTLTRHAGLVLVTGPTGSGKSTTLARMVQRLTGRPAHIVTIEDPVEYLFPQDHALVHQREVGTDVPDFASGVVDALREDPDVLVIGEMRDPATMAAALTAAETGHLVLATMHNKTAADAIGRIVHAFPSDKEQEIRAHLASVLHTIAAQVLYRKGGRTYLLREILVNTPPIAHLIREGKDAQLSTYIESGTRRMRTLKQAVGRLSMAESWPYEEKEQALRFIE